MKAFSGFSTYNTVSFFCLIFSVFFAALFSTLNYFDRLAEKGS